MISLYTLSTFLAFLLPVFGSNYDLDSLTDSLLREVISRIGPEGDEPYGLPQPHFEDRPSLTEYPSKEARFEARRDAILGREEIRDKEYLEHSSVFGHQFVQGGAGEGLQRLKPDGSIDNIHVIKTDKALPSYCVPANPCPQGYSAETDGCLDNFENTASFSREYQSRQDCMCDTEHMFDCPGATRENEIDALARTFENEGLAEVALDRLIKTMEIEGEHKNLVAKKFFSQEPVNPYLEGEKLPVVAKKAPKSSIK